MPDSVSVKINKKDIPTPDIFRKLQEIGNVSEEEMWNVFNMGVGLIVITSQKLNDESGCFYLGKVQKGTGEVILI